MKTLRIVGIALLVSLTFAACSRNAQARRDKFIQNGNRYLDQGKYAEAEIEYRSALQVDPNSADAHERLASAYVNLGDWNRAVVELQRTVDLHPNNARAQLNLGNLVLAGGDFDQARQICSALLQQDPNNADAHSLLANVAEGQGKHDEATNEIAKAISLKPDNAAFYVTRGAFESNAAQLDVAERNYKRAVEIDPKNNAALVALREIYERQQRWDDAERILQQNIKADPRSVSPRLELAKLYLSQQRKDAAEQVLLQAQKDLPGNPESYRLLPHFYSRIGANDKALALFESLYKQHLNDSKTAEEYARLLFAMGQVDKANAVNEQVLAESHRDSDALTLKGQIFTRQGNPDAAVSLLRSVVNDQPTNAMAHYALGSALSAAGNQNAAKEEWRRAAQLQPTLLQVQRVLAQVALAENDKTLLRESAEQITTNDPQSPDGYVYRAQANADDDRNDEAEADLNKAMQVAPQNPLGFEKMAEWRFTHKRYADAEKLYEQALERDPNYSDALRGLVATYKEENRVDKISPRVHEQIAKAPNNSTYYFLFAESQEEKQDLAGSQSSAQKAINLDPNNNAAFELLCRVEMKGGASEKALASAYDWTKKNPKYGRAYVLAGSIEESRGNWKSAGALYRQAIDIQPHYPDAENNLAYLLLQRGEDTDAALSLARAAHTEAPNAPTIDDTLAWAFYHKGLYKAAIGLLEDALRAEPQSALYHYHIGLAYEKINDRSQAKLHLRRVLSLEPNSAQADLARKELQDLGS